VRAGDGDGDFTAWEWQGAPFISGNAGDDGVVLTWFDGTTKTYTTGGAGNYYISVPFGWTGTITLSGRLAFVPVSDPHQRQRLTAIRLRPSRPHASSCLPPCRSVPQAPPATGYRMMPANGV
jgi:hypothetical protein